MIYFEFSRYRAAFLAWLFLFAWLFIVPAGCRQKEVKQPPNVVLILADDLGWKDLGFMGSNYYETPCLDAFSRQSTWFTQAYAGAANCAPSRACLLTGLNTPRHGIYTVSPAERGDARTRRLIPARNTMILNDSFVTIAEKLQHAGYRTCSIGKWHIGQDPTTQGFDLNIAGTSAGHPKSYFSPYLNPALPDGPPGEYLTDRLTKEAIRYLCQDHPLPFFLYLPYFAIHTPLQGRPELVNHYRDKPPVDGQGTNADYAALVTRLDWNIGRLLQVIDSLALRANTLVIFSSDNGGISYLSRQHPLRAGKGGYYEGGVRVPLLFSWPGHIPSNQSLDIPVSQLDLFSTILDFTGIDATSATDGLSLYHLLKDQQPLPARPLFWHFPIYLEAYRNGEDESRDSLFRTRPGSTMRFRHWKMHYYLEDQAYELYNLLEDPGEKQNLIGQSMEIEDTLKTMLAKWWENTNAPIPATLNPDFDPDFHAH